MLLLILTFRGAGSATLLRSTANQSIETLVLFILILYALEKGNALSQLNSHLFSKYECHSIIDTTDFTGVFHWYEIIGSLMSQESLAYKK